MLIGFALDKLRSPWIVRVVYTALLLGIVLIQFASSDTMLLAGIAIIGLAAGSEYGLLPYYLTRLFGLRSFGQLYGAVYSSAAVASGIGPVLMGTTFDRFGSYGFALIIFEIAIALSILFMFAVRSFKFTPEGMPMSAPGGATS